MIKKMLVKLPGDLVVGDLKGSDGLNGCYRKVVLTDLNGDKKYDITLTGGDAKIALEEDQQVLVDLRCDHFKFFNEWRDEYFVMSIKPFNFVKMKELYRSIELPPEKQFGENWNWENSSQQYELDSEFKDLSYFTNMEDNDLISIVRKMENFLMERGISSCFMRNYALADEAFRKMCNREDNSESRFDDF